MLDYKETNKVSNALKKQPSNEIYLINLTTVVFIQHYLGNPAYYLKVITFCINFQWKENTMSKSWQYQTKGNKWVELIKDKYQEKLDAQRPIRILFETGNYKVVKNTEFLPEGHPTFSVNHHPITKLSN